jgi:hypothetical protein
MTYLEFPYEQAGAVFDLPAALAKELLAMKIDSGEVIEAIEKVLYYPELNV